MNNKAKEGCATAILAIIGLMVSIPLAVIWRGYVFSKLWGWFIVERFGLPMLSVAQAVGFAVVVGMFTYAYRSKNEDETWEQYAVMFIAPAISLLMGWIVQHWV